MTIQLSEQQLKKLIQDSVSEAMNANLMKLRALAQLEVSRHRRLPVPKGTGLLTGLALPSVSKKEQQEIERLHGVPSISERPAKTVGLNV